MAIDLDKIKANYESLTDNNRKNYQWKPQPEQQVRIVPYKHQPDNPFIELSSTMESTIGLIFLLNRLVVLTQSLSLLKS